MEIEKYELIYKINKKESQMRLLGELFWRRNRLLGHFIYKNRKIALRNIIETKNLFGDELVIDLIFYKKIYNKGQMFFNCNSLLKIRQVNKVDKQYYYQINNMEEEDNLIDYYIDNYVTENTLYDSIADFENDPHYQHYSTVLLKTYKDSNNSTISKIYHNLQLVSNASNHSMILTQMFSNCTSLISISDMLNMDNMNIIHMEKLFEKCISLVSLPDISKWNTNNVTDMNNLFRSCTSLISLPDISKWNTSNVIDMSNIFYNCQKLVSLPDISKWNTKKVINMKGMFINLLAFIRIREVKIYESITYIGDLFL